MSSTLRRTGWIAAASLAAANAYQLALLIAAARPPRPERAGTGDELRLAVVIPAHDEERLLPATLAAVRAQDYPAELVEIVVVADNCSDATADVARAGGARVLERDDPARRGKSHALAWAMPQLAGTADAFVVLDADCVPSPNLLSAAAARLAEGVAAVQCDDVISNPSASSASALRAASFALLARVRARGKDRLGLSCGLFGTGMGFRDDVVASHAWDAEALDDGLDYHLRLVDAGVRVRFIAEAQVASTMPTTGAASIGQQRRWEAGKLQALRRWLPRLVRRGVDERDPARLVAAFDLLVPAQAPLAALNAAALATAAGSGSRGLRLLACANAAAQAVYVVAGLRVAQAPPATYRHLALAPLLVAQKLAVYARLALDGRVEWATAHREPAPEPHDAAPRGR